MNCVKIPLSYLEYDIDWYYNEIKKYNPSFLINIKQIKDIINYIKIKKTKKYSDISKNLLFFILKMVENDNFEIPINFEKFGSNPKWGFELVNKKTYEGLGIYHSHISEIDSGVLIWYITWNINGFIINFIYEPHPSDDYRQIKNDIYSMEDSYHYTKDEYLNKLTKLLTEHIIISYESFNKLF